jgi:hypothetical protein
MIAWAPAVWSNLSLTVLKTLRYASVTMPDFLRTLASDAGADQGLVVDEPERKADQDWREGREPRTVSRLPDGRGRHSRDSIRRNLAADR